LHGTWIADHEDQSEELFFVWAERQTEPIAASADRARRPRIQRHPYAATTIEIAGLLDALAPDLA
jgi:hypothetical protein